MTKILFHSREDLPFISIVHSNEGFGRVLSIHNRNWKIEFSRADKVIDLDIVNALNEGIVEFRKVDKDLLNSTLKIGSLVKHPNNGLGVIIGEKSDDEIIVLFECEIKCIQYGKPKYGLKFSNPNSINYNRFFSFENKLPTKYDFNSKKYMLSVIQIYHKDYGNGIVIGLKGDKISIRFATFTETFDLKYSLENKILKLFGANQIRFQDSMIGNLLGRKYVDRQKQQGIILAVRENKVLVYISGKLSWLNFGRAINRENIRFEQSDLKCITYSRGNSKKTINSMTLYDFNSKEYMLSVIQIYHKDYGNGAVIGLEGDKISIIFDAFMETFDLKYSLENKILKLFGANQIRFQDSMIGNLLGRKYVDRQKQQGIILAVKENKVLVYISGELSWLNLGRAINRETIRFKQSDLKCITNSSENSKKTINSMTLLSVRDSYHQNLESTKQQNTLSIVPQSQYRDLREFHPFLGDKDRVLSVPCYYGKSKLYLMGWHILNGKLKIRWKPDHDRAERWRSSMICIDRRSKKIFFQGDIYFNSPGSHPIFLRDLRFTSDLSEFQFRKTKGILAEFLNLVSREKKIIQLRDLDR